MESVHLISGLRLKGPDLLRKKYNRLLTVAEILFSGGDGGEGGAKFGTSRSPTCYDPPFASWPTAS